MEKIFGTVSVIVPIYNVEDYLRPCIESIQNQTYSDLEIILVDDGSPDNSGKICDEYAAKDARIRVLHNQNGGAARARNAGIEAATGEYISFVDGDDSIKDTMIEELLTNLHATGSDISVGGRISLCGEHTLTSKDLPPSEVHIIPFPQAAQYVMQTKFHSAAPWGRVFRRSMLEDIRFNPTHLCYEDYPYSVRLFLKAKKVCYTDRALYNYTYRENSAMRDVYRPKHECSLQVQEDVLDLARNSSCPKELLPYAQAGCLFQSLLVVQKIAFTSPIPRKIARRFAKQIRKMCNSRSLGILPKKTRLLLLMAGYLPGLHRIYHRKKYSK